MKSLGGKVTPPLCCPDYINAMSNYKSANEPSLGPINRDIFLKVPLQRRLEFPDTQCRAEGTGTWSGGAPLGVI